MGNLKFDARRPLPRIKPVETKYRGYRFRSRLEARWAVFFSALGIAWEYEPQGFDLGQAGWYLPDFFLPDFGDSEGGTFVEVKAAELTAAEALKARSLCRGTGCWVLLAMGVPDHTKYSVYEYLPEDDQVEKIAVSFRDSPESTGPDPFVGRAITAARSARFEHGETPL
jgi:hypothetical protein